MITDLILLSVAVPIAGLFVTAVAMSVYYDKRQKARQKQATLLGVVMPKQNKGEPNA